MNRMIVGLHCSVLASGTAVIDVPEEEHTHHNNSNGSSSNGSSNHHRTVPLLRTPHSNSGTRERADVGGK
jgi:hypothetical protein